VLQSRTATESERCFFGSHFSVTLLHDLADFEKPEHANAPNMVGETCMDRCEHKGGAMCMKQKSKSSLKRMLLNFSLTRRKDSGSIIAAG